MAREAYYHELLCWSVLEPWRSKSNQGRPPRLPEILNPRRKSRHGDA